jgi:hypothetical protein
MQFLRWDGSHHQKIQQDRRACRLDVCFGPNSMLDEPPFGSTHTLRFDRFNRAQLTLCGAAALLLLAQPAAAGIDEAVKAMQAGDLATAEKELQVLVKERDPRAQFFAGLYIYGNPDSKLYDVNKATPMLLDAAERGYVPAMLPIAGAYAEGKGVPKSLFDAYKWVAIAERWHAPVAPQAYEQLAREMKPDEIEKAKAAAAAYTFKTK